MINSPLVIPAHIIAATVDSLQGAGRRGAEGIVLWLGRRTEQHVDVVEAYVPLYESAEDYFRIPPAGMRSLLDHLGREGSYVASQVHSHPFEAFHSLADDKWAIVRHVGALSLVLPNFAAATTIESFLQEAVAFRLEPDNSWNRLSSAHAAETLRIV